jgi:hypothetical protein
MIYQHADGDPAHALIFIKAFAKRYAKERGHDPEYFIAQFLRHEAFDHQAKMEEKVKLYSKKGNKEIAASYKWHSPKNSMLGWGIMATYDDADEWTYDVDLKLGTISYRENGQDKTVRFIPQSKEKPTKPFNDAKAKSLLHAAAYHRQYRRR